MGWVARIDTDIAKGATTTSLSFTATYFDESDSELTTPLHHEQFTCGRDDSLDSIIGQVIAAGQAARDAIEQVAILRKELAGGKLIHVP